MAHTTTGTTIDATLPHTQSVLSTKVLVTTVAAPQCIGVQVPPTVFGLSVKASLTKKPNRFIAARAPHASNRSFLEAIEANFTATIHSNAYPLG